MIDRSVAIVTNLFVISLLLVLLPGLPSAVERYNDRAVATQRMGVVFSYLDRLIIDKKTQDPISIAMNQLPPEILINLTELSGIDGRRALKLAITGSTDQKSYLVIVPVENQKDRDRVVWHCISATSQFPISDLVNDIVLLDTGLAPGRCR